jgi:putative acetyltransferase
VEIRPERTADEPLVDALQAAAFAHQPEEVVALVHDLRAATEESDRLSLVAVEDGEPVGHAMFTPSLLDATERLVAVQVLSPVGVHPRAQRHGVGSALVEEGLRIMDERGVPAVFLEGDPAYYRRFGFEQAAPLGFRKPSLRIPDAAFQVRRLAAYETWMTGTLVYSEPFWRNDLVGLRRTPEPGRAVTAATIREFTSADEEAIVALSLRAWPAIYEAVGDMLGPEIHRRLHGDDWRPWQEGQVRETLARDGMRTWVAEADGSIAGFASAHVVDPERRIGELAILAVEPESQRQGLGLALTDIATEWLRSAGMRVAFIGTGGDAGHAPARALYEQAGYTAYPVVQYYKAL